MTLGYNDLNFYSGYSVYPSSGMYDADVVTINEMRRIKNEMPVTNYSKDKANGMTYREEIVNSVKDNNPYKSSKHSLLGGLLACGILLATGLLLIRSKSGFLSKLNPRNWFKK